MFVLGNETDDFVKYCLKGIFCVCSLLAGECVSGLIDALCYIHWRSSRLVSSRLHTAHSLPLNGAKSQIIKLIFQSFSAKDWFSLQLISCYGRVRCMRWCSDVCDVWRLQCRSHDPELLARPLTLSLSAQRLLYVLWRCLKSIPRSSCSPSYRCTVFIVSHEARRSCVTQFLTDTRLIIIESTVKPS